jgi:hypothetical protein
MEPDVHRCHGLVGRYELAAMAWGDSLGLGATRRSFAEPNCAPADGRQAPPYPPGSLRQAVQQSRGDDACALYRAAEVCCRCIGLTCLSPPALLTAVPVQHLTHVWPEPGRLGHRRTYPDAALRRHDRAKEHKDRAQNIRRYGTAASILARAPTSCRPAQAAFHAALGVQQHSATHWELPGELMRTSASQALRGPWLPRWACTWPRGQLNAFTQCGRYVDNLDRLLRCFSKEQIAVVEVCACFLAHPEARTELR